MAASISRRRSFTTCWTDFREGVEPGMPATISVVVPTYNRAELLGVTLDAIIGQETPAIEIIVVDDGSTDHTSEVLRLYSPWVRGIRIGNSGDLAARNVGLRAASGKLVAFCDSDDVWRPRFLTAMAGLWRSAPGLAAGYANFQAIHDEVWSGRTKFDDAPERFWDGLRPITPECFVFDEPIVERLLKFQPFFPSAMTVDRAVFLNDGGWDETVSRIVGTDFATALRMAERPLGIIKQPLVGIRRHPGNFSGDVQAMNLGDASILEHVLATRASSERYRDTILKSIADRRAAAADTAFDRRDFAAVQRIQSALPATHRPFRRRVKAWISGLPGPLARGAASLTSRLSDQAGEGA